MTLGCTVRTAQLLALGKCTHVCTAREGRGADIREYMIRDEEHECSQDSYSA
jgi:hypothetical protein